MALRQPGPASRVNPVVIVGGGLSGLAAGTELTARGIPVILLEQKPFLGGRAYSFTDATTGDIVDNGQHVLIAACAHTLKFLERIGTRPLLAVQSTPSFLFHHPVRGFQRLRFPPLPPPLHLAAGILASGLFSFADRLRILRAGVAMRRAAEDEESGLTVSQWLDSQDQTEEARRSFWDPLAVSVMNEHCDRASALVFLRSLRQAFLGGRGGASMAIPSVGLTQLYVDAAASTITREGGIIRCSTEVVALETEGDTVVRVRLRDGTAEGCSAAILALPPSRIPPLLPDDLRNSGFLSEISSAPASPIISIHLWFEKNPVRDDVLGIIGRRIQWVFMRPTHVSAVISAAHGFVSAANDDLAAIAVEDLRTVYPELHGKPRHALVIREKRATFSCTPDTERLRPGPETPLANMFLAGDWTATGLPATIEGAVLSGERAAALAGCWLSREEH